MSVIKWIYPDNIRRRKPECIDIWDEIDNIRGRLWLGGLYRRKPKTRPAERYENRVNKEEGGGEV